MLSLVLLIYLGVKNEAGAWYFWICGVIGFAKIIRLLWDVYKEMRDA